MPVYTDHLISSQRRYDRFGTSPKRVSVYTTGLPVSEETDSFPVDMVPGSIDRCVIRRACEKAVFEGSKPDGVFLL